MKYFGWILLFFLVVYIIPLGSRPMFAPDEFRYAEIPAEMIDSGNYTVPHLLGVRYFEKPPMGYWLVAGSFKLFGRNAFALRLPMALAAGLTAFAISLLVQQALRDDKLGALASIIYLSFALVYGAGTIAVLDSILTMFITCCCGCAYLALQEKQFTRRKLLLLLLCGAFAGGGFLTKGFVAFVVPALTVTGFLIWQRRWKEFLILPLPILIAAAVVVAPWAVKIHHCEPDFWRYFIIDEHVNRFFYSELTEHPRPWYYYLPVLIVGAFPAALLVPAAGIVGKEAWKQVSHQDLYRYSLCFFVLPLIFFSCCSGKLPTYILPCYAPAALLIATGVRSYFNRGEHHRSYNWMMTFWGVLLLVAAIGLILLAVFPGWLPPRCRAEIPLSPLFFPVMGGVTVVCAGMMLYSAIGTWRGRLYLFFAGVALLVMCANWFITGARKMPEEILRGYYERFRCGADNTCVVTTSGQMQSVAWCFRNCDLKLISPGETGYGVKEAQTRHEKHPLISNAEMVRIIRDPARNYKVLVLIYDNDDRTMAQLPELPGRSVETQCHIRAICYPERRK